MNSMRSSLSKKKRRCSKSFVSPTSFAVAQSFKKIALCRAKDQTRNKPPEKYIDDVRKIFIGGIPSQVRLGKLIRRVQAILRPVR